MTDPARPRRTAADFDPEVLRLFDKYVHGAIDRRVFLEGAAKFAVGGVTAAALLEALSPNFALAEQVARTDLRGSELPGLQIPGHAAWLQQRHDPALRRGGGTAGLGANDRLLQPAAARSLRLARQAINESCDLS
ncbi:MAG TPA: hypothetical protein VNS61_15035 [Caldimonas sp.]|nr:hypothetical protein [Caldimonas sp.]